MNEESRMQEYLALIRNSLGWNGRRLGEELEISRQAVCNMEKKHARVTKTMYYALLYIFEREIKNNDRSITELLLRCYVKDPSCFTGNEKEKILSDMRLLLVPRVIRSEDDLTELSRAFRIMAEIGEYSHLLKG